MQVLFPDVIRQAEPQCRDEQKEQLPDFGPAQGETIGRILPAQLECKMLAASQSPTSANTEDCTKPGHLLRAIHVEPKAAGPAQEGKAVSIGNVAKQ